MFFAIVRVLVISYLTYLVLNETGTHTAIVVYIIMMDIEFFKWSVRDNHKHHRRELKKLESDLLEYRTKVLSILKTVGATQDIFTDRLDTLELIVQPDVGDQHED